MKLILNKSIILSVILCCCIAITYSQNSEDFNTKKEQTIFIGGDINYPPFKFLDKKGNPTAYNVDLTNAIAIQKAIKLSSNLVSKHNVFADKDMLMSVLRNILSNAIKFSYNNIEVKLSGIIKGHLLKFQFLIKVLELMRRI